MASAVTESTHFNLPQTNAMHQSADEIYKVDSKHLFSNYFISLLPFKYPNLGDSLLAQRFCVVCSTSGRNRQLL